MRTQSVLLLVHKINGIDILYVFFINFFFRHDIIISIKLYFYIVAMNFLLDIHIFFKQITVLRKHFGNYHKTILFSSARNSFPHQNDEFHSKVLQFKKKKTSFVQIDNKVNGWKYIFLLVLIYELNQSLCICICLS